MLHGPKEVSFDIIMLFTLHPDVLSLNGSVMIINQSINQSSQEPAHNECIHGDGPRSIILGGKKKLATRLEAFGLSLVCICRGIKLNCILNCVHCENDSFHEAQKICTFTSLTCWVPSSANFLPIMRSLWVQTPTSILGFLWDCHGCRRLCQYWQAGLNAV